MTTLSVSMPEGMCSKLTPKSARTPKTRFPKPISVFIIAFSIWMIVKSLRPAMPVI